MESRGKVGIGLTLVTLMVVTSETLKLAEQVSCRLHLDEKRAINEPLKINWLIIKSITQMLSCVTLFQQIAAESVRLQVDVPISLGRLTTGEPGKT